MLVNFSEHGARPHQRGGFSLSGKLKREWNPELYKIEASGPVRVLVRNGKPVTPEGEKMLEHAGQQKRGRGIR